MPMAEPLERVLHLQDDAYIAELAIFALQDLGGPMGRALSPASPGFTFNIDLTRFMRSSGTNGLIK